MPVCRFVVVGCFGDVPLGGLVSVPVSVGRLEYVLVGRLGVCPVVGFVMLLVVGPGG